MHVRASLACLRMNQNSRQGLPGLLTVLCIRVQGPEHIPFWKSILACAHKELWEPQTVNTTKIVVTVDLLCQLCACPRLRPAALSALLDCFAFTLPTVSGCSCQLPGELRNGLMDHVAVPAASRHSNWCAKCSNGLPLPSQM